MRELLENTAQRAISYLETLGDRGVAPSPEAVARLPTLDEPLPEEPTAPDQVINLLDEICSPATMAMAGPRFFGFVIGGSLPVTLAANWLAWVHVDGAFGLWAITAPSTAHLAAGLDDADSWATDFHKWLNVPYDSGVALVRDADALRAAMAITADYLPVSPFETHQTLRRNSQDAGAA